jgi:release factor glutamine methyltransferase
VPGAGIARCWEAGADGRALRDKICVPDILEVRRPAAARAVRVEWDRKAADEARRTGCAVNVVSRVEGPFGPVLANRRELALGSAPGTGQFNEELVVLRAVK